MLFDDDVMRKISKKKKNERKEKFEAVHVVYSIERSMNSEYHVTHITEKKYIHI